MLFRSKDVCAYTLVPDYNTPNQICDVNGYVDINCSNINNYTFFAEACTHPVNITANQTNCATIYLGSIVNETGASFALADEISSYMKVYTTSLSSGNAGGHIPQIT